MIISPHYIFSPRDSVRLALVTPHFHTSPQLIGDAPVPTSFPYRRINGLSLVPHLLNGHLRKIGSTVGFPVPIVGRSFPRRSQRRGRVRLHSRYESFVMRKGDMDAVFTDLPVKVRRCVLEVRQQRDPVKGLSLPNGDDQRKTGDARALEDGQLPLLYLRESCVLECADERILRQPLADRLWLECPDAPSQYRPFLNWRFRMPRYEERAVPSPSARHLTQRTDDLPLTISRLGI